MRLSPAQQQWIRDAVAASFGPSARVRLFGSRVDDSARGGDVDLLVELDSPVQHPVRLAAELAGRISRRMHGRKVDVLIAAEGLSEQPIHAVARREGILL
ncbi:nucleotidyltransferase domain-containing protein [Tepidimonas sp.]|uniref:nucleotidyltransferase domain-containing protein n=1 Tax=Tepidimonas sp. TaxID=2002775 RepID=UPI002FE05179